MKQDVYTSEAQLQAMLDELEHAHDLDSKAHTRIARRKLFKLIGNLAGVLIIAFLFITWLQVEDARSRGEVPTVCGYQIYEVKTGSMVPTIPVKSLILSRIPKDAAKLAVGDIVTFQDNGVTITPVSYTHLDVYKRQALTSLILLIVFSYKSSSVASAITGVPFSIREMVPCFNSPAA